jgi:hypothetical protein
MTLKKIFFAAECPPGHNRVFCLGDDFIDQQHRGPMRDRLFYLRESHEWGFR